VCSSEAPR